jgi:ketosteroid isomerase-like protein
VPSADEERVEIVRTLLEMFRRGENETPFAFYAKDVVWEVSGLGGGLGLEGTYHGHEGVRAFWRNWLGAWEEIDWEETSVTPAGDTVVVLIENQRNRGRGSGIWIPQAPYTLSFTFDGNLITKVRSAILE